VQTVFDMWRSDARAGDYSKDRKDIIGRPANFRKRPTQHDEDVADRVNIIFDKKRLFIVSHKRVMDKSYLDHVEVVVQSFSRKRLHYLVIISKNPTCECTDFLANGAPPSSLL
jgi:hypothetical protein